MVASQYMQRRPGLDVVDDQAFFENYRNKPLGIETSVSKTTSHKFS
jgi:hypothetical protein